MSFSTFQELADELMHLYAQEKYVDALVAVEGHADRFPDHLGRTTFWRMCLLSLTGRTDDVLSVFRQGLDSGLWWAESQFIDPDLDAVRDLPEFRQLVTESNQKCVEMRTYVKPDRTVLVPENPSGALPLLIALHGRNGNKDSNLEYWDVARRLGWLVLSPQSRQALYAGSYCWDDAEPGMDDILHHFEEVVQTYHVDRERIVFAGFSQGSGMAVYAALSGRIRARGFMGVGTFIAEPRILVPLAGASQDVRCFFFTGERDHTLEKARAIQKILQENRIPFAEEVYPEMGHTFPPDFETVLPKAIEFILKVNE